ncbi:MAG TPA: ATP-dependent DNA helicase, partial [Streptosporangiaceae bacterium]|nr:ATP-dependent DNA helicase [Streptosporangiaceae bacterium]
GLDGRGLARLGAQRGRDDWQAAGGFLNRYAARFDLAPIPAYDYAEIIRIAAGLLDHGAVRDRERKAYDVVMVDEYQDTDPAQEELLHALAGDGRELIAVGDPDQSIYAFRGADVHGIARFPERFRTPDDQPARVVALRTCRRSGTVLLAASRRVASRLPAAPGGHRYLDPLPSAPPGLVRVITATSASQEATVVADVLRRAHLHDGVGWSSMAVLVRSVTHQVPLLRRALMTAGVPTVVAGDELPLTAEPGARPLLLLMRCALRPAALDEDAAAQLLTGPLGGSDALGLRRLRRALRAAAQGAGEEMTEEPLAAALRDLRELTVIDGPAADAARRVAGLLALARDTASDGNAQDTLWAVWHASGLAREWQAVSAAGGTRGAAADRDLDAVVALFEAAARFTERLPPGSASLFLDSLTGQEIPGDTLADRAPAGDAVRILTAHRSKGLEWDVVVVAGVQEGIWPDLRLRSSLLGMDELVDTAVGGNGQAAGTDAAAAALASKLLSEERRLFYVAATRARRMLVVTAAGGEDSDERPSRFLAELAGDEVEIEHVSGSDLRWLSLPALTADLRRAAADRRRPLALRQAAAAHLARLAQAGVRGADPGHWYQLTTLSDPGPLAAPVSVPLTAQPSGTALMRVSPSQVESFTRCGLRWLLEVAAGARSVDVVRHFGIVIHAAAVLAAEGAADDLIGDRIDEVWHHLDFGSAWYSEKQRELAHQMVDKFLAWHRQNPRDLVAFEESVRAQVGAVEITGRVDRLERDAEGRAIVVDLKTGSAPVPASDLDRHPQLGVYQLAVMLGAFERFGLTEPGGAELVQVGKASLTAQVRVQPQGSLADDPEPGWARELVETVAAGMAGPLFQAKLNPGCRNCPVAASCPAHVSGEQVTP